MKRMIMSTLALGCFSLALCASTPVLAKDVTITGVGACAKCILKRASECQNTITVDKGGKSTVYYLVQNDISKQFGTPLCQAPHKVKATGTVEEVGGKMELTPTSIELVKD